MKGTVFKLATWLACVTTICAQTLVSSLEARPELVLFNNYIQSIPTLLNTLTNITNYTLLAPSDTAMTRWLNDSSPPPSQEQIEATLNYHILHGGYSLSSFSAIPQFASSYLSNSSFTNVTGGAVVELVENGGSPVVLSALKQGSSITKGDLIANGGLFHIIDTVLSIPQQESATATEADLEYYRDIMTKGGYSTGKANDINNALGVEPDMTFFVPNTAAARDNFTSITAGWTADQLNALFTYHAIPGIVAYSSSMRNGTVLPTVQGSEITIYMGGNGTMYANNVRILATDYLISNGVMHTIDGVLNPYNITKPSLPTSPSTGKLAVPIGAIVGIAIAGVFVLGSILTGAFFFRRRRSKRTTIAKPTKPTDSKNQTPSKRRPATERSDNRRRSKGSTSSKTTDSSHRNLSKRSTATKMSQRTSHKEFDPIQQTKYEQEMAIYKKEKAKYEKEKVRVEVEVRRVVGEQLDAFRRSGYYDTQPGKRTIVPVIPAVELDAGFSFVERHELSGGDALMPVIEEGHELPAGDVVIPVREEEEGHELPAGDVVMPIREEEEGHELPAGDIVMPVREEEEGHELPAGDVIMSVREEEEGVKRISRVSSRSTPVKEEERTRAISRTSSWTVPVAGGGVKVMSRASSRSMPVVEEGTKTVSRASSRAMILDRR